MFQFLIFPYQQRYTFAAYLNAVKKWTISSRNTVSENFFSFALFSKLIFQPSEQEDVNYTEGLVEDGYLLVTGFKSPESVCLYSNRLNCKSLTIVCGSCFVAYSITLISRHAAESSEKKYPFVTSPCFKTLHSQTCSHNSKKNNPR